MGKPWRRRRTHGYEGQHVHRLHRLRLAHLIAEGYTSSARLVIEGGWAVLMGAVTNLRPDLMKAVIAKVPFVDVINSMLDEDLPLTVAEFEEWGNPKILADYRVMRAYCPYSNLEAKAYPAILLRDSFNDSQVMYSGGREVRSAPSRRTRLRPHAHGRGPRRDSGRYDALRETASDYAFILWQVGLSA